MEMQEEREISLVAAIYSMIKHWKVMLIVAVIMFIAGYGFMLYRANKSTTSDGSAKAVADEVTAEDIQVAKKDVEEMKKYVENSAFMKLDYAKTYRKYISYLIDWKEPNLSSDAYENKSASLYGLIGYYYPSEDLEKKIEEKNEKYKDMYIHQLVSPSRSGNVIVITFQHSGEEYVADLCNVIDESLNEMREKYRSYLGDFDFIRVQDVDRKEDANTIKNAQNEKRNTLKTADANASKMTVTSKPESSPKVVWIGFKNSLLIGFVAIFCGLGVGFLIAVFGKKYNSAEDITEFPSREVVCIFKKDPESGLDKMFYKKNDRYNNPERYLSILEKNLEDAGVKKLHLYNCSETDLNGVEEKISEVMGNTDVSVVSAEEKDRFYLDVKDNEAIIILAKGGDTRRDALLRIEEHLRAVGAKNAGIVFAV